MIDREFIKSVPKSDIHTHLDGSMRLSTLIELARERNVELPSYEAEGLKELVFKPEYKNLEEYLLGFRYTCAVLLDTEALQRVACELVEDSLRQGVRYMEVRFAPQLLAASGEDCVRALKAVSDGLAGAAARHNTTKAVSDGADMPFEWSIICCAMRNFRRGMSGYYDALLDVLPGMKHRELMSIASVEAVRVAVTARDRHGVPVTGFDLAGEESGYPAGHHFAAYEEAHRHFIRKTVHAGEAYGPESIYEAIARCHAERIGHGTFLFAAERIKNSAITDKAAFADALADYIATMRVTIEVCPTSNLQTIPELGGNMANHPVRRMVAYGIAVAVATDNTLVSHTDINRELALASEACELDMAGFRRLVLAGFKGGFYPGKYAAKRDFVRRAAQLFDKRAADFQSRVSVCGGKA
ncbi:MAG: adenosine deaminase family protein [Kiritimatiellae bacterium]|nr:adenosine deaminase family protein [Kiritimatiellia bacterium]